MRSWFGIWIVASAVWICWVGYMGVQAWPHLSLDLSPTDSSTLAAYDGAVLAHVAWYGAAAIVVPLVVFVVGRVVARR